MRTLKRVVRCQAGGAKSRRIVRVHYHRYWRAFDRRFGTIGLGSFEATAYGPPWNAMEGTGITSTGVPLYAGVPNYGVAVDPSVIPYGTKLRIWPNPHHYRGWFVAFDTGGAIRRNRIDFYVWQGRAMQNAWGRRGVQVKRKR